MSECKIYVLTVVLLSTTLSANAQKLIKGIVVDSVSLENLQGVHIKVKNSPRATFTDAKGIFILLVNTRDSLTFSYVGYAKVIAPVYDQDEIMFVQMHEQSTVLHEVVILDKPLLLEKYIDSPTLRETRPLHAAGINFSYLTKAEKEKRKLVEVTKELEQARIYVEIVTDPELKRQIMEKYSISEARFFELLAAFNENNRDVMYSANANIIFYSLYTYFENSLNKK